MTKHKVPILSFSGSNPVHDQGDLNPGQRRSSHLGELLRRFPFFEGAVEVREKSFRENVKSQFGGPHARRSHRSLPVKRRSLLLRVGRSAGQYL
jgi:hypothetical protein